MLHEFITENRDEIIGRCRAKVATRSVPPPTADELSHGVPLFLDQLVRTLRTGLSSSEIGKGAHLHGNDLLRLGFTVSQVVHDYGDVCQSITDLAMEMNAPISTDDFRTLNRCLDDAIAGAVTEYGRGTNESGIAKEIVRGNERLGFFAHELGALIYTASLAFEGLKTGNVGVAGSTGAVLDRSLKGLNALVRRSLAEVQLTQAVQNRERFKVATFIEQLHLSVVFKADIRGVTLSVLPIDVDLEIEADREVLAAVVMNLLQNAFKFTWPQTTVTLRVSAKRERVLIDVEDECGGLPDGDIEALFRPFVQRNADRTGVGLGLAFSRWAVEENSGRIDAHNMSGKGCVFTIDVPRVPVLSAIS